MEKRVWTLYRVRWDFLTALCASVPANPEVVKGWIDARKPDVQPPGGRSVAEIHEEIFATLPQEEQRAAEQLERTTLIFQRDPMLTNGDKRGLVMRSATIRAHIKDCARVISREYVGKVTGEAAFSTRVINAVYPDERMYWVPLLNQHGAPLYEADGFRDKFVHTFRGSALKRIEYVLGARMEFTLKVLGGKIKQEDIELIFQYGGVHGYAGERGDGEGRYTFKVEKEACDG